MAAAKIRVRLFHWHEAEAAERAQLLAAAGFDADYDYKIEPGFVRRLAERKPHALIIDLSRLPSHGREVGIHARRARVTRFKPLVFVGGNSETVAKIRALIPDATFTEWAAIKPAVRQALRDAPVVPVLPDPYMQRWAATPLAAKLGLKPGVEAALLGAPDGFAEFVRAPEAVGIRSLVTPKTTLILLFARSCDELDLRLNAISSRLPYVRLWICWPKAAARKIKTDLSQKVVLETARAHGLATYKILSIDRDWSGMLFCARREK